jgi:hypothetical protein
MLIIGLVIGYGLSGGLGVEGFLIISSIASGFLARYGAGEYMNPGLTIVEKSRVRFWVELLAVTSVLALVPLIFLFKRWLLIPMGIAVIVVMILSLHLELRRRDRRIAGEMINIFGLGLVIPSTYYSITGLINEEMIIAWVLTILFFWGSIFRVRYLSRNRKELGDRLTVRIRHGLPVLAYHLLTFFILLILSNRGIVPVYTPLVFVPVVIGTIRTVSIRYNKPVPIKKIGYRELCHTLVFAVMVVAIFRVPV